MSEQISVVIPTYNRANFICRAVKSALDQTWKEVEVIVIDDGSTDNTRQLLEPFFSLPNFRYIYQVNKGRSIARNEGTSLASASWILYLDSDDYLPANALETLYRLAIEAKDSDIVYANFLFVDNRQIGYEHNKPFAEKALNQYLLLDVLLGKFWLTKTGTYLVQKKLVLEIGGFSTGFEPSEDLDFMIRILMRGKASYQSDVVLYVERHDENTDDIEIQRSIVKICKYYLENKEQWGQYLNKKQIDQVQFALKFKIANGSYEVNKHREAFTYYSRLIRSKPSLFFDKFIFKQFFASIIPPVVKMKFKRNGRVKR